MDFTPEEQSLINYYARGTTALEHWGFVLAVLVPVLAFALYGLSRRDLIALGMSFFALLGCFAWYVLTGRRHGVVLASICRRLQQQGGGMGSQPSADAGETSRPA